MMLYARATGVESTESIRDESREWLLDYNRGDVEATLVIRCWLDDEGGGWPILEDH